VHPTPGQLRRQAPRRRPPTRRTRTSRRLGSRAIIVLLFLGFLLITFAWAVLARIFAPSGNTQVTRFDTLIVLGVPADKDGNPRPTMQSRVDEAVREYERGVAPRMIVTGGLDGRQYREATVMARVAQAQGVPASAIFIEPEANDTIQNACYSARIMKAHGWRSAEVIANAGQLPRASLIFSHVAIDWRVHVAPPIEPQSTLPGLYAKGLEIVKTARYLLYANRTETCSP
jgi:uncharacterized SAM-binding protein YcdF (DUF218 family)